MPSPVPGGPIILQSSALIKQLNQLIKIFRNLLIMADRCAVAGLEMNSAGHPCSIIYEYPAF